MNPDHRDILNLIEAQAHPSVNSWVSEKYLGTHHRYYGLSVPQKRAIAKNWVKKNKQIDSMELEKIIGELFEAPSYEEKTIAAAILGYFPRKNFSLTPQLLGKCLNCVEGWAEIDSLCYGVLTQKEIAKNWALWSGYIKELSQSPEIAKRRASLVLLTKVVREEADRRFFELSIEIIEKLKGETHILITKAVSWLLRELTRHYKDDVEEYLNNNENSLPKIALREARKKIATGTKS